MKINVVKDEEQKLFGRREVVLELDSEGKTPSRMEVRQAVADKLKVGVELVAVREIKQKFGEPRSEAVVYVYKKEEDLLKLEKRTKKEQEATKPKEESKEEKAEAPKEEAPKEKAPVEEAPKEEAPKEEEKPKEEEPKEEAPKEGEE